MRVPEGWKGDRVFKFGLCVMKEVVEVTRENEKLKREVKVMKNDKSNKKKTGVYEKYENIRTWTTIAN